MMKKTCTRSPQQRYKIFLFEIGFSDDLKLWVKTRLKMKLISDHLNADNHLISFIG